MQMVPLESITVGQFFRRTCEKYPERPAVICHDRVYTYAELDELTVRFASELIRDGVVKGDHVGIFGEVEVESLALFLAVQRIGAVAVLVNTMLEKDDLECVLRLSDVRVLCVGSFFGHDRAQLVPKLENLPCLERVCAYGETPSPLFPLLLTGAEPDAAAVAAMEAEVTPDDTAVIIFTSGSTGSPKAVMTSHYSRVNGGIQQGADIFATCEDVFCVAMPMFHCFCVSANIMAALSVGACLCMPKDRHTLSILTAVSKYHCTVLHSVPSMFHAVMCRPDFGQWDLSSLRTGIIAGASYPPEDFDRVEKAFGMTLLSSLGQTEATAGLTICRPNDSREKRCFTVGVFMDHVEGKIAAIHTGKPLPQGETGEICVRGYLVMQGFYKQPELTAQTIDKDGWLHTGDLAYMDEDGYLVMKGRIKDIIIRGGENISPLEVANEIDSIKGIADCKVVGVPDTHYGEEACACVVKFPGAEISADDIHEYLSSRLAAYKVPKYVLFFDQLPLNSTGKVDSKAVKEMAVHELGLF